MSRALPLVAGATFLLLASVCLVKDAPRIEQDIEVRSAQVLADSGLSELDIDVSGRDVILTGRQASLDRAERLLATVAGIRQTTLHATPEPNEPEIVQPPAPEPVTEGAMEDRIRDLIAGRPIRFRTGSADLLAEGRAILDELAPLLLETSFRIEIEGHTDATGSAQRNLLLSQRRAEAVMQYLASRGVDRQRMTATGVGAARPIASNATAAGRRLNRRIEFNVLSPD